MNISTLSFNTFKITLFFYFWNYFQLQFSFTFEFQFLHSQKEIWSQELCINLLH